MMRKLTTPMVAEVREEMILATAKSMFAMKGFDGVSMRDLAAAVGLTPPTLYHYFPTKLSLQIATLEYAQESTRAPALAKLADGHLSEKERLRGFIQRLCERFHEDPEFLLLLERALVSSSHEIREAFFDRIFNSVFLNSEAMLADIAPGFNTHLFTCFVYGMVVHTYKLAPLRRLVDGYQPEYEDPRYVADHIMALISTNVLKGARGIEQVHESAG